jgi:uroporphyrinogen decarboxylase
MHNLEVRVSNLFEKTLKRETVKVPPVWMMRQAGRYHQHYQNLRQKHSFMDLCLVPELAAEVAMGPVQDFDFDAAILFSDLLFPFKVLGQGLEYTEQGPRLGFQLNPENFSKLKPWQDGISEMEFQKKAMVITRSRLAKEKGLIGFVGGPWTLFVYSVEGSHAGSLIQSKKYLGGLWQSFNEMMVPFLIENIKMQFEGGADVVMLFDTAAGELSPSLYSEKVVPQLAKLAAAFPGKLGYYSKGTTPDHFKSEAFKNINWAGRGFDHRFDLTNQLRQNQKGFVQGNFDQSLLHLDASDFNRVLNDYLAPFKEMKAEERAGWVCGLGHGVLPKTPEANVKNFVQTVRKVLS